MQEALYFNVVPTHGTITTASPLRSDWAVSFCACDEFVSMPAPLITHGHVLRLRLSFRAWGSEVPITVARITYDASRGAFEGSDGWVLAYRYVVDPTVSNNVWVLQHSVKSHGDFQAWVSGGGSVDWMAGKGKAKLRVTRLYGKSVQRIGELEWSDAGAGIGDETNEKLVCYHPTNVTSPAVFALASLASATPLSVTELRGAIHAMCAAIARTTLVPASLLRCTNRFLRRRRLADMSYGITLSAPPGYPAATGEDLLGQLLAAKNSLEVLRFTDDDFLLVLS